MENRANYSLVGMTVIILSMAVIALIVWMSFGFKHQASQTYMVYMNQSVSGLNMDSTVQFNGVNVGSVSNIKLNPKNPQQVILYLKIKQGTPITESTIATLAAQGITGISYVALQARSANSPLLKTKEGESYPVINSAPSLLVQLDTLLRNTSLSLNQLLSQNNIDNLSKTLANMRAFTDVLAADSNNINATLQQSQAMLSNFNALTQQGNLAIGSLIPLIARLNEISGNVNSIASSVKQNPAILLRGSIPANLGPGEH